MKTGQLSYVEDGLRQNRIVSNSSCPLTRNGDHQGRAARKQCAGHVEFLEEEEVQNDEPTSATDASDTDVSIGLVPSHYSKNSSHKTERSRL